MVYFSRVKLIFSQFKEVLFQKRIRVEKFSVAEVERSDLLSWGLVQFPSNSFPHDWCNKKNRNSIFCRLFRPSKKKNLNLFSRHWSIVLLRRGALGSVTRTRLAGMCTIRTQPCVDKTSGVTFGRLLKWVLTAN